MDKGLVIVGVHAPEFEFEKNLDNVRAAVEKFGIKYPVIQDNDKEHGMLMKISTGLESM